MALSQKFIPENPEVDRVNTPGTVGAQNWSWRMPCLLEDLLSEAELNGRVEDLARARKGRAV
jgi:4-alpha-glucanotransferase